MGELDNHLGMNEKTLAEFIIDLADKHKNMDTFRKALIENGAEFSGGLMRSMFDLVNRMKSLAGQSAKVMEEAMSKASDPVLNKKRAKFTGLAIPDDFDRAKALLDAREMEKREKNEFEEEQEVDDMMAMLEGLEEKAKPKSRSRSRERKRSRDDRKRDRKRSRSRDRHRRRRTRSRSRDRDRGSDRSRDRHGRHQRRSRSPHKSRRAELDAEPVVGKIYDGKVTSIQNFGC